MNTDTKQLSYWQGAFGDEYIDRNSDLDLFSKRKPFFDHVVSSYPVKSILEVGCSIGGNLHILKELDSTLALTGVEPNGKAVERAKKSIPTAKIIHKNIFDTNFHEEFDLVFTAGVLIHIGPKDIDLALSKIHAASKRFILAAEYYSPTEETIPYRNLDDALFKRPYDTLWTNNYEVKIIESGYLDMKQGFDDCHWWLLEKSSK